MPVGTASLDVAATTLTLPGDGPSSHTVGDTAYAPELEKTFQRPVRDTGAAHTSSVDVTPSRPVVSAPAATVSTLAATSTPLGEEVFVVVSSTFDAITTQFSQPGDAPSSYAIFGDPVSSNLDVPAFRSIHAGASYFSRIDAISTVDFTENIEGALDMIFGQTITSIGGGQTIYVGLFEDATESEVSLPVPAGQVQQLIVRSSAPPGTNESATFTLRKNAGDSPSGAPMSVAISGSGVSASTSANNATCSTGDRLSVKIVTSANCASAIYRFSLKYQLAS